MSALIGSHPFDLFVNPRHGPPFAAVLSDAGFDAARAEITSWPGYAPTPLVALPGIARSAGLAALAYKDEGPRFGLGSFKALGGAYAVRRVIARVGLPATVTCATDGNHGRSVAWGAARAGARCVIFVHATVGQGRVDAIARFGAEVIRVSGTYDDAVREAQRRAEAEGWFVVSDTSWPGNEEVPADVMQGYRLMAAEAAAQWQGRPPTHAFMPGGVGGAAAAVAIELRAHFPGLRLIVVEPDRAACLMASARAGRPVAVGGALDTMMAGLACGEPSLIAWPELAAGAFAFMAVPDSAVAPAMRLLRDAGVVAGESAVAGLIGLLLAAADPAARQALGLDGARVLLFGTEGATDPELYRALVGAATNEARS